MISKSKIKYKNYLCAYRIKCGSIKQFNKYYDRLLLIVQKLQV